MKTAQESFIENQIVEFARFYCLRPRIHMIRAILATNAGAVQPQQPLDIPTEYPFLWCALGWASNRPTEGRYTSILLSTEQVKFMSRPMRLACFGGPEGGEPTPWGPSRLIKTDRFVVDFSRELAVDPAESYPGPTVASIIDLAFIGFDLMPSDDKTEAKQV